MNEIERINEIERMERQLKFMEKQKEIMEKNMKIYKETIEKLKSDSDSDSDTSEEELYLREVADALHKLFCNSNHTDECGWYYGDWDKKANDGLPACWSKREYYAKAKYLVSRTDVSTLEIIAIFQDTKELDWWLLS